MDSKRHNKYFDAKARICKSQKAHLSKPKDSLFVISSFEIVCVVFAFRPSTVAVNAFNASLAFGETLFYTDKGPRNNVLLGKFQLYK